MVFAGRSQQQVGWVPPGGEAGQGLIKQSDTDGAFKWDFVEPVPGVNSGGMQPNNGFTSIPSASPSITRGAVTYMPFWRDVPWTLTGAQVYIGTTVFAGNSLTYGVAQCLSTGMPGPAIAVCDVGVEISTVSISTFQSLGPITGRPIIPAGWSFVCYGNDGTDVVTSAAYNPSAPDGVGWTPLLHYGNAATPATSPGSPPAWKYTGSGFPPATTPSVTATTSVPQLWIQGSAMLL